VVVQIDFAFRAVSTDVYVEYDDTIHKECNALGHRKHAAGSDT